MPGGLYRGPRVRLRGVQRHALGLLFTALAAALAAVAVAALIGVGGGARRVVVAFAALAVAAWLGSLALSAFRRR